MKKYALRKGVVLSDELYLVLADLLWVEEGPDFAGGLLLLLLLLLRTAQAREIDLLAREPLRDVDVLRARQALSCLQ
jgi:hypothetical protein